VALGHACHQRSPWSYRGLSRGIRLSACHKRRDSCKRSFRRLNRKCVSYSLSKALEEIWRYDGSSRGVARIVIQFAPAPARRRMCEFSGNSLYLSLGLIILVYNASSLRAYEPRYTRRTLCCNNKDPEDSKSVRRHSQRFFPPSCFNRGVYDAWAS
jgi:hypothetical protein